MNLSTAARFAASVIVRALSPSGSRWPPVGFRTAGGGEPLVTLPANSDSSENPPMSVLTAFGAVHETHGRRKNVPGDSSWLLIALRIACW